MAWILQRESRPRCGQFAAPTNHCAVARIEPAVAAEIADRPRYRYSIVKTENKFAMMTHTVANLHDATVENSTSPIIFRMDGGNAWLLRRYLLEVCTWKLEGERLSLRLHGGEKERRVVYARVHAPVVGANVSMYSRNE